jgi:hypothetical protein
MLALTNPVIYCYRCVDTLFDELRLIYPNPKLNLYH